MLECAIPTCNCQETFLRSGSPHLVDRIEADGTTAQHMIWLCGACTAQYAVQTWRPPGEQIRLRPVPSCQRAEVLPMRMLERESASGRRREERQPTAAHPRKTGAAVRLASAG